MYAKSDPERKRKQVSHKRQEARSALCIFNQRMLSDFETETHDFAVLCMIASAHGIKRWPEEAQDHTMEARFLTFH